MSITHHPIKLRSPFHCRLILISSHSHLKPRNRGPNSVAKTESALTVVPHYSHFICKLAFTCSVSQLSLPLPVSLKDPVSDWSPPHSVNQRTHQGHQIASFCLCFVCSLCLMTQTDTQKDFSISLCFDSQRPLYCPVFCQIS